jgi:hypothetical protein
MRIDRSDPNNVLIALNGAESTRQKMNHSSSSNQITLSNIAIFNKADQAILTAIRCPQSGHGVIRALETACEALDAYSMVAGLPRVNEWSEACATLLDKIVALQSQYPQLGQYQSSLMLPVFSLLASPPANHQGSTGEQLGLEILGRILIGAISSNDGLSVTSVEAWATLRRARKSGANTESDWAKFCISYPRTEEDIRGAYEWVRSKKFARFAR